MKRINVCVFLLVATLFCGSCFPYHFTIKPGISGNIIDAGTRKSLQGAKVSLTTYSFPANKEKLETTTTQKDGSFIIPAEQQWGLYIIHLEPGKLEGIVSIQMEGYKQYIREFHINTTGPSITKFKDIVLEHLP